MFLLKFALKSIAGSIGHFSANRRTNQLAEVDS